MPHYFDDIFTPPLFRVRYGYAHAAADDITFAPRLPFRAAA